VKLKEEDKKMLNEVEILIKKGEKRKDERIREI
jgi:hypothetical protein